MDAVSEQGSRKVQLGRDAASTDDPNPRMVAVDGSHGDRRDSLKGEENVVVGSGSERRCHGNNDSHGGLENEGIEIGRVPALSLPSTGREEDEKTKRSESDSEREEGTSGSDSQSDREEVREMPRNSSKSVEETEKKEPRSDSESEEEKKMRSDGGMDEKTAKSDRHSDEVASKRSDGDGVNHPTKETPRSSRIIEKG